MEQLLDEAASDAVLVDLDGDGQKELGVLSPFHGENIYIYKKRDGRYEQVYAYEKKAEFTHAIYGENSAGNPLLWWATEKESAASWPLPMILPIRDTRRRSWTRTADPPMSATL